MEESHAEYIVDKLRMDTYLKDRFRWVTIRFALIMMIMYSLFTFIMDKQHALDGAWSFLFSIPLIAIAFLFGVMRFHAKLRNFSEAQFLLTVNSIILKLKNDTTKEFKYSEIAVINTVKFGTNIVKGNWLTKIDYYRPKKSTNQLDHPKLIFIPSITSNYVELIAKITNSKEQSSAH